MGERGDADGAAAARRRGFAAAGKLGTVALRRFEPGDVAAVHRWFNNERATRTLVVQRKSFSTKQAEDWVRRAIRGGEDRKYAILMDGRHEPVGFTALYGLQRESGPELGALIGDDVRSQGLGRRAEALALHKAFEEFGAARVYGEIPVFNDRAKRAVAKLGWRYEELLPNHGQRDGKSFDCELWAVLRPDFYRAVADLDLD